MNKILIFVFVLVLSSLYSSGQKLRENIAYIVDSILVKQDPEEGNEIKAKDVAEINVIKNKDSLQLLGYGKFEGAVFIFTKNIKTDRRI